MDKHKFHIVGESMGGNIAGVYSALHPNDIVKTTMMCPQGIKFKQMDAMKAEYERSGECILLPSNLRGVREMFDFLLAKRFPFPNFVLDGILQMRLLNDEFNKKRELSFHFKISMSIAFVFTQSEKIKCCPYSKMLINFCFSIFSTVTVGDCG